MKRTKTVETAGDLFSAAAGGEEVAPTALIASPLVAESARFRRIASVRIPDPRERLADAMGFYAPDGRLVSLMSRVGDSARRVWGKLNAKLRELERRNHRLEDLGARLGDLAAWSEESVPHEWLRGLLATAAMRGDAQIRPDGERSRPPLPKIAERAKRHLEIVGTPCAETIQVSVAEGELSFQDLELAGSNGPGRGDG